MLKLFLLLERNFGGGEVGKIGRFLLLEGLLKLVKFGGGIVGGLLGFNGRLLLFVIMLFLILRLFFKSRLLFEMFDGIIGGGILIGGGGGGLIRIFLLLLKFVIVIRGFGVCL